MSRMRTTATASLGLLPPSRLKNFLLRRIGHEVSSNARIGPVLLIHVENLRMIGEARIGPFNVFRDLSLVELGENSTIGQWNWFSAAPAISKSAEGGSIRIGNESAITSRHYFDCSGGISIGNFTTFAGVRSTVISHGIDWRANRQKVQSVSIGHYAIVGSNCAITPGSKIPDQSVVGMGSSVSGQSIAYRSLSFSPRAEIKKTGITGKYFSRARGYVD